MLLLNFSVLCTRHLTRPEYGYLWPSAYRAKSVKQLWDVDNNIFSFYCKLVIKFPPHIVPQMCIAITLSLFSIHWRLLGWKSAFAIMCSIAFGGFFLFGFFFCIYLNTCTCKRLYNVCTLVYKRKIQILQFIRNVGPHIPISLINHFILSYIFSTRQLQILSWKNNIKIWSHISFWIPYMNERFFFFHYKV